LNIRVFYEEINFRVRDWRKKKEFIRKVIEEENKIPGDLCFIFTNDRILQEINIKYLGRSYYTDIITFDYVNNNIISGDAYISCETVNRNAKNYNVSYENEILRVMIHGVMHLCGYKDKTKKDKVKMKSREEHYLKRFNEEN